MGYFFNEPLLADGKPVDQMSVDISNIPAVKPLESNPVMNKGHEGRMAPNRALAIDDLDLIEKLDAYSIEAIVELKISRFLDQIGAFYPENMHDLIMSKVEKPLLIQILRRVGGNQVQASKILGINRNTLRKKIKIYGI